MRFEPLNFFWGKGWFGRKLMIVNLKIIGSFIINNLSGPIEIKRSVSVRGK
jgi:hypothetical protein